jgi:DNA-binding transcriptional LysR family regulator
MPWDHRMRRRLRLRDLDTLLVVVERGSMAKAAAQLSISQPAISKAIADMEQALGVRLLDRTSQGIEPTIYGRALLKSGRAIFDDLRQGIIEIDHLSDRTTGEVRIATSEPYAVGLLPLLIDQVSSRYPKISIGVSAVAVGSQNIRAQQFAELRERKVDLVFGPIFDPIKEPDLEAVPLFEEPIVAAAGTHNQWARRRAVTLADLIDEPWCLQPPDTFAGMLFAQAFRDSGLNIPARHVMTSSVHFQIGLLATERYLTMLPGSLIRFAGERFAIKALPIKLPVSPRPAGVIILKDRILSPVAQLIVEYARTLTKSLADQRSHLQLSRRVPRKTHMSAFRGKTDIKKMPD